MMVSRVIQYRDRLVVTFAILFMILLASIAVRPSLAIDQGSPILVNIIADTVDLFPGDGYCSDLSGDCSLRAAIMEANASPGDDEIQLSGATYTLSLAGAGEDDGLTGDLDITDSLSIIGTGTTTVDADSIDRVFHVQGAITVTLQALNIRNGRCPDDLGGLHRNGGGLFNDGANMTLHGVEVAYNESSSGVTAAKDPGQGGGIYNTGRLTLVYSQVDHNRTGDGYSSGFEGGYGGGIYNDGELILDKSTINDNVTGNGGSGNIGAKGGDGGGLYVGYSPATASLTDSYVIGNTTGNGGAGTSIGGQGGYGGGIAVYGNSLTLLNSYVLNNVTGNGGSGADNSASLNASGGYGGGIIVVGQASHSVVELTNSAVNNNHVGAGGANGANGGGGGGIYFVSGDLLSLSNSQVNGNTAGPGAAGNGAGTGANGGDGGNGGGIYIYGAPLSLVNSSVSGNGAGDGATGTNYGGTGGYGGGIFADSNSALSVYGSTIHGNHSGDGANGGTFAFGGGFGGGMYLIGGTAAINGSTVSGNSTGDGGGPSPQGSGGRGGGIYSTANLALDNSTISGNSTGVSGGGTNSFNGMGAGLIAWGLRSDISNSTISNNVSSRTIGGLQIANTLVMTNTIIANNIANETNWPDCYGTIVSGGYNLVEEENGCTITGDTTGNITGQDPHMGPLQNNGGPSSTHALLAGSVAIDAGGPAGCSGVDQRGYGRPVDGNGDGLSYCDMGAFEVQSSEVTTVSGLSEGLPTTFGATMATMTRAVASADPMTITVEFVNAPPGGALNPGEMPVLWFIDAAVDSGLELELTLCYTDEQLGSLVESELEMYRDPGSGWINMGGVVNPAENCLTLSGVTSLSAWTLATAEPVEDSDSYSYLPLVIAP
jgi:hypothetical protein